LTAFAVFPTLHRKSRHGEFYSWISSPDRARIAANMRDFRSDRILLMFREPFRLIERHRTLVSRLTVMRDGLRRQWQLHLRTIRSSVD
jgi:hypothetical protein